MPEADIDRLYNYNSKYLADILKSVKTIAMVGASGDKRKFSYGVLRQLNEIGYEILPVNPNPKVEEIRGLKVYHSLEEIENRRNLPLDIKIMQFQGEDEFKVNSKNRLISVCTMQNQNHKVMIVGGMRTRGIRKRLVWGPHK